MISKRPVKKPASKKHPKKHLKKQASKKPVSKKRSLISSFEELSWEGVAERLYFRAIIESKEEDLIQLRAYGDGSWCIESEEQWFGGKEASMELAKRRTFNVILALEQDLPSEEPAKPDPNEDRECVRNLLLTLLDVARTAKEVLRTSTRKDLARLEIQDLSDSIKKYEAIK